MNKMSYWLLPLVAMGNFNAMEKKEDIDKANSELVVNAAMGNQEKAELLMAQGANPHAFNGLALVTATHHKQINIINLLLKSANEFEKNKAFRIAAADGAMELTRMFMQAGADPDDENGQALYLAAKNGREEVLEFLTQEPRTEASLIRGIDGALEGKHKEFYERLQSLACKDTKPSPVPLFKGPIEIKRHDPVPTHLRTPFLKTVTEGNCDQVSDLLAQSVELTTKERNDALFYAARNGDNAMIELLISAGFDVHGAGDCALKAACNNNRPETARLLLQKGADIHTNFEEPLCIARRNGFKALEDCLLSLGADDNAVVKVWDPNSDPSKNKYYEARYRRIFQKRQHPLKAFNAPLAKAVREHDCTKAAQEFALASTGERVDAIREAASTKDTTMLHTLLRANGVDERTIETIIKEVGREHDPWYYEFYYNARMTAHLFSQVANNPETTDDIHQAIADGQIDTYLWHKLVDRNLCDEIAFVVKSGGNIDSYHGLALKLAINKKQTEMVHTLLTNHANIHVDCDAPLRLAAAQGNEAIVEQLLAAGADANAPDPRFPDRDRFMIPFSFNIFDHFYQFDHSKGPQAPLRLAAFYGNEACFRLLIHYGANTAFCANQLLWNAAHGASEPIARYILENHLTTIDAHNEAVIVEAAGHRVNYNGAEAEHTRNEDDQKRAALVSLLLRHGARATAGDGAAFQAAARCGFIRTLQVLSEIEPEFIKSHAQEYVKALEKRRTNPRDKPAHKKTIEFLRKLHD